MKRTKILILVFFVSFCTSCKHGHTYGKEQIQIYEECLEKAEKGEHTFNIQSIDEKYLKEAATCTSGAIYYYSCSCGEKGTETFESGEAVNHSYVYEVIGNATCFSNEYGIETCSKCGDIKNKEIINSALKYHVIKDGQCIFCHENDFVYDNYELNEIVLNDKYSINHAGIFYSSTLDEYLYMEMKYCVLNIPIIDLSGNINNATKENEVDITFTYSMMIKSLLSK